MGSCTCFWDFPADVGLQPPQIGHPLDRGGGDLRVTGSVEFIEPPAAMFPAPSQLWTVITALARQRVVGGTTVYLQDTSVALEVPTHAIPVGHLNLDNRGRRARWHIYVLIIQKGFAPPKQLRRRNPQPPRQRRNIYARLQCRSNGPRLKFL